VRRGGIAGVKRPCGRASRRYQKYILSNFQVLFGVMAFQIDFPTPWDIFFLSGAENGDNAPCHTIGRGGHVGPDLRGVADRRDRAPLTAFIMNPGAVPARREQDAL
jgi:hypothetical protein